MERHELKTEDTKGYALAGKALLTIENAETGNHFTYQIRHKDGKPAFVAVLTGQDNTSDFTFIGTVFVEENGAVSPYRHSNKSRMTETAQSVAAFKWVWTRIMTGRELPENVHVYHHGYCGRCGKLLTVPESIQRGLGPECAARS